MSNLSEEEQKAIENLKKDFILMNNGEYATTDDYILYNYISKLQKENEVLKNIQKEFAELFRELKVDTTLLNKDSVIQIISKLQKEIETYKREIELQGYVTLNYVSKDKIRELIKEYKPNQSNTFIKSQENYINLIQKIEELLEE